MLKANAISKILFLCFLIGAALVLARQSVRPSAGQSLDFLGSSLKMSISIFESREKILYHDSPIQESLPSFQLIDQYGNIFDEKRFLDKNTILAFTVAHCSISCPFLIRDIIETVRAVDEKTQIVIITTDPKSDSAKQLLYLAKSFSLPENAHILSGDEQTVFNILHRFGSTQDKYNMWSPFVYFISKRGLIRFKLKDAAPKERLVELLIRLKKIDD